MSKKKVEVIEVPKKVSFKKYMKFISVLVLAVAFVFLMVNVIDYFVSKNMKVIDTCGDGTFYDTCSLNKPYYCQEGILVEKASVCGCPSILNKDGEFCVSQYQNNPKLVNLTYVVDGESDFIEFTLYKGVEDYIASVPRSITYQGDEKASRRDFKVKSMNEELQREYLIPLAVRIQNLAPNDLDKQARIAISLVQNIPYNSSGEIFNFASSNVDYSRYPYETLYSMEGVCEEKSALLAFLLREFGYGSVMFYYPEENHEAMGIKCPVKYSLDRTGYCFIETTGPSIITNNEEYYLDWGKLTSAPETILLSEGSTFGLKNLYEYKDARKIIKINDLIEKKGKINYFLHLRLEKLKEKYGLDGIYS